MAYDRFLISPLTAGLENNVKPFLIPDNAFAQLDNAYLWRQRVRKRPGAKLMNDSVALALQPLFSRLRVNLMAGMTPVTTDGSGNLALTTLPGTVLNMGAMFSVGNVQFNVITVPTVVGNAVTLSTGAPAVGTVRLNSTGPNVYQFQISGGNATIANTQVYFYPALPVMGLISWEDSPDQFEPIFAFDTEFAYTFVGGGWERLGTAIWTGTDAQFFWAYNYRGTESSDNLLFVTNFNVADQIKYYDPATTDFVTINPIINVAGDTIETTKIILPFQDRLLFFNNIVNVGGNDTTFSNEVRWSQIGSPLDADAFREDIPGKGGVLRAPVKEDIITAQVLGNKIIVYFETSTWELVFNSNQASVPFSWYTLNIELGADSTFSHIPMNKFIIGMGNQGVQTCNGIGVERIDNLIPDEVIKIHNANAGNERVYGIRDYHMELIYWTFPSFENAPKFPDRVMIYNYKSGTWAFMDDSITCFGYFQEQPADVWASDTQTWQDDSSLWSAGSTQSNAVNILAGNQEGYVFIMDPDLSSNSPSLQITNMTQVGSSGRYNLVVINHNLVNDEYVLIQNCQGNLNFNNGIYLVTVIDANNISVLLDVPPIPAVYTGGGTLTRVSRIDILTKQYNFYMKDARNAFVAKVDFLLDKTENGQITVDSFVSSAGSLSLLNQAAATGSLIGTGVLETSAYVAVPLEEFQDRVWHAMYLQAEGECVQLRLYLSNTQMRNIDIVTSEFELNAMVFWATPTSSGFTYG